MEFERFSAWWLNARSQKKRCDRCCWYWQIAKTHKQKSSRPKFCRFSSRSIPLFFRSFCVCSAHLTHPFILCPERMVRIVCFALSPSHAKWTCCSIHIIQIRMRIPLRAVPSCVTAHITFSGSMIRWISNNLFYRLLYLSVCAVTSLNSFFGFCVLPQFGHVLCVFEQISKQTERRIVFLLLFHSSRLLCEQKNVFVVWFAIGRWA